MLETTYHEILKTVHPHPTLSEAIHEATADAFEEAIHMKNQLILNSVVDLSSRYMCNLDILDYLNDNSSNDGINFYYLGKVEYSSAWNLQKKIHDLVKSDDLGDIVLFLEHNHVYTLGKNADSNYILDRYQDKIDIIQTDEEDKSLITALDS